MKKIVGAAETPGLPEAVKRQQQLMKRRHARYKRVLKPFLNYLDRNIGALYVAEESFEAYSLNEFQIPEVELDGGSMEEIVKGDVVMLIRCKDSHLPPSACVKFIATATGSFLYIDVKSSDFHDMLKRVKL